MSAYVIDASVAAKWFTEEEYSRTALMLTAGNNELHAPDFFMLELDSVVCKWIRRGIINQGEGERIRSTLARMPIYKYPSLSLQNAAFSIANSTRCGFYDCLYLALAFQLRIKMVTADRRFYNEIRRSRLKEHVVWVEDVKRTRADA